MNLNKKINAFSLIETVVAMVIILLCLGLATTLFVSVSNTDKYNEFEALYSLKQIASNEFKEKSYLDKQLAYEKFYVEVSYDLYKEQEDLIKIRLEAYDIHTNNEIAVWEELKQIK